MNNNKGHIYDTQDLSITSSKISEEEILEFDHFLTTYYRRCIAMNWRLETARQIVLYLDEFYQGNRTSIQSQMLFILEFIEVGCSYRDILEYLWTL